MCGASALSLPGVNSSLGRKAGRTSRQPGDFAEERKRGWSGPIEDHALGVVVLVFGDGPAAVGFAEHVELDPAWDGVGDFEAGLLEGAGSDDVELDHRRAGLC